MLPNMRNLSSRRRRMSGGADESLVQGKNFMGNMPGQMRQSGGGAVLHGAPVLGGDAMLLDGDLRGKAGMGSLDASTAAIRGMQDGGRRRKNGSARRSRRSRRNNAPARRGRNNASARRSRRGRNNASARRSRRGRNNASARRSRRGRNNASARRSRRGRNNASARRNRRRRNNNMYGGDGEEEYLPEVYEDAVTPVQRRSRNMYGGAHSLLPTDYASVNQSPSLLSASAAAKAGTAFSSDPFANGSGSA